MITVDVFLLFIDLKSIKSHWYLQSKWYYSCRLKNWNLCLYFCLRNGFSGRTSFNTFKHISLHIESCCCMWHPINTYKNYETQPGIQINSWTSNPLSDLVEMDLIRTSNKRNQICVKYDLSGDELRNNAAIWWNIFV